MAKDRINLERLAKMLGLPAEIDVYDDNADYIAEAGSVAYKEAMKEGASGDKIEEAQEKAEEAAQTEVFQNWHRGVTSAAEELLSAHHLELEPVRRGEAYPFEFEIVSEHGKTWRDAARAIATTIEGVGLVSVAPEELRAPKEFVLSRLGWISQYPVVYGTSSAERIYERSWR